MNAKHLGLGAAALLIAAPSARAAEPLDTAKTATGDWGGLAIGSNHLNSRVAEGLALRNDADGGNRPLPGSESVCELFYAWTPLPFVSLQPNLQVVRHPGGSGANETVVVVGLRTSVDF